MKYQRALLREIEGYTPGEQPKIANIIKLNTNESPYPPSPKVVEAIHNFPVEWMRKYPDPVSLEFRRRCAGRYGYDSPDWVIAGNGMDELLAMAIRTFVDPGDAIVSVYPTYTLYETLARMHGAQFDYIDMDESFALPEALFSLTARLCFVPRPNAPTGIAASRADMERLCRSFKGLVFIDEAYADFADDTCMDFPKRFDNVIVGRTFSKSFALSGLRIGTATARPELIAELIKTKDSYNLNGVSQAAASAAMDDYAYMRANVEKVRATRTRLTAALRDLGFSVPESQTNFVLASWSGTPSARDIFAALRDRAILVRYFDARRLQDALRITIGSDEETDALLKAISDILAR